MLWGQLDDMNTGKPMQYKLKDRLFTVFSEEKLKMVLAITDAETSSDA